MAALRVLIAFTSRPRRPSGKAGASCAGSVVQAAKSPGRHAFQPRPSAASCGPLASIAPAISIRLRLPDATNMTLRAT